jgi:hypothetical protein
VAEAESGLSGDTGTGSVDFDSTVDYSALMRGLYNNGQYGSSLYN